MRQRFGPVLVVVILTLAGCGAPAASPGTTNSASASPFTSVTEGQFRLDFRLARLSWAAGDSITGDAALSSASPSPVVLYGAGTGIIVFDYVEVGGERRAPAISTADCAPHTISAATPIVAPLGSTGGYDLSSPAGAWVEKLTGAGSIQLPPGTCDVTARAEFYEGVCGGPNDHLNATLRVHVGG
ncbi:MAG: hypothetical protein ACYDAN_01745 [Candidatus Limnocylindrales bacterium]